MDTESFHCTDIRTEACTNSPLTGEKGLGYVSSLVAKSCCPLPCEPEIHCAVIALSDGVPKN